MLSAVLIANRGEIARRITRTLRRLRIRAIAIYSDADRAARHALEADLALHIGGARPADSYLRIDAVIDAALRSGAEAIHPGYGFLSENAAFARAVQAAGLIFIGPDPASIEAMGSKAAGKAQVARYGVPVVPGYMDSDQTPGVLADAAAAIGFPLLIKASAGGGGKGMRIVRHGGEFSEALATAQREAQGAFGDSRVILERYVEAPRHIEFQIFGDRHGNVIHLNERECSAQRRHQKVLEESPSPFLTAELRAQMGAAAVAAARAVDYVGAGTVEFIVDPERQYYFIEMNTRLQVEHPVTELTHGIDLVEWQLRIASGEPLPLTQAEVRSSGHAVEVRVYAENPRKGFLPGSGPLRRLRFPVAADGIRIDAGVVEGDTVTVHYDPMIAKLISYGGDRDQALDRLDQALAATVIEGPAHNVEFLRRLIGHPLIRTATITTKTLDEELTEVLGPEPQPTREQWLLAAAYELLSEEAAARQRAADGPEPHSPWATGDGFRLAHEGQRRVVLCSADASQTFEAYGANGHYRIEVEGRSHALRGALAIDDWFSAEIDGVQHKARIIALSQGFELHSGLARMAFEPAQAFASTQAHGGGGGNELRAPMPGRVVVVAVASGDEVEAGQTLIVMEAMKMELKLTAPRAGVVEQISVEAGLVVESDVVLLRLQ